MPKARIIDVFPFLDEEGPLLARFLELESIVDLFVGVEANLTHAGAPQEQTLRVAISKLGLPTNRFLIIKADISAGKSSFERDALHKNAAKDFILKNLTDADFVIFGDVDEVPRLESVHEAILSLNQGALHCVFAQEMCFGYLNYRERTGRLLSFMGEFDRTSRRNRRWLGTVMQKVASLKHLELSDLRRPGIKRNALRLGNGGWHFSTCGGRLDEGIGERVRAKFSASSHTEFSWLTTMETPEIERRLIEGKDLLGRRFVRFEFVNPDSFLSDRIQADSRLSDLFGGERK